MSRSSGRLRIDSGERRRFFALGTALCLAASGYQFSSGETLLGVSTALLGVTMAVLYERGDGVAD